MTAEATCGPADVESAVAIGGLTCTLSAWTCSGTYESEKLAARHHFAYFRELPPGQRLATYGSFDGERPVMHQVREHDAFFLPMGRRWSAKTRGNATVRILACDLEPSAFEGDLDDRNTNFDLEPRFGESPIAPGLLERLEALCLAPGDFSRSYADALAVVFTSELLRAFATQELPPLSTSKVGKSRFKPVLDHIDDTLEADTSLSDLAALTGLSVSRFSHAFNAAYGVAPHRYILRRRIDKAKTLLSTSDATVAAIAAHVGFSSQSRFTQLFSRQTGLTPSAYRTERLR